MIIKTKGRYNNNYHYGPFLIEQPVKKYLKYFLKTLFLFDGVTEINIIRGIIQSK